MGPSAIPLTGPALSWAPRCRAVLHWESFRLRFLWVRKKPQSAHFSSLHPRCHGGLHRPGSFPHASNFQLFARVLHAGVTSPCIVPASCSILAPSAFRTRTVNPSHLWRLPLRQPPCVLWSSPWLRLFLGEAPSSRGACLHCCLQPQTPQVDETAPWLSQVIGLPLPSLCLRSPYFHSVASAPKPPPVHVVLPSPSST